MNNIFFIFLLTCFTVKSQVHVDTLKLENVNLNDFSLNDRFQYKLTYNGTNLFLLNKNSIVSISVLGKTLVRSVSTNFLEYPEGSYFLVSGINTIGILEYDPINASDTSAAKTLFFHQLDTCLNLICSREFIMPSGSIILREDIQDIAHFSLMNDSLFISFGKGSYWEISKKKLSQNIENYPTIIKKIDIITKSVYNIETDWHKNVDSNYQTISFKHNIVLNSKNDPFFKNTFPSYYIINNKVFFIGETRYFYNFSTLDWHVINYNEHLIASNIFFKGFYNYNPKTKEFLIIDISELY